MVNKFFSGKMGMEAKDDSSDSKNSQGQTPKSYCEVVKSNRNKVVAK